MEVRYGPTSDHSRFVVYLVKLGNGGDVYETMLLRTANTLPTAERYADRVAHAMEVNAVKV